MRKQYTRIYVNPNTGEIDHLCTQDTPIIGEPIRSNSINYTAHDFIIEHDQERHVKAKELRQAISFKDGVVSITDLVVSVKNG